VRPKNCCGVDVYSRCMSVPWMGRIAKTLWATSPTVRKVRLLDDALGATIQVGLRAMARCRGPTNMRRVRVVLLQSAIGGAAALRRHTQAGDDDGAHHSPRP
jgi:hypothetical protein